jgi:hypothetical protein
MDDWVNLSARKRGWLVYRTLRSFRDPVPEVSVLSELRRTYGATADIDWVRGRLSYFKWRNLVQSSVIKMEDGVCRTHWLAVDESFGNPMDGHWQERSRDRGREGQIA